MVEKNYQTTFILWDSEEDPNNQDGLVYTWNGYQDEGPVRSLLGYIETHGDRIREKYLAWVHDLGETKIGEKRLIDHLALNDDFSYWWMTSFVEKSPWQSPLILEVIRYFAVEEILLKEKPQRFRFVSSNQKMENVLQNLCVDLGIEYEWKRLPKKTIWNINLQSIFGILPHPLQALIGLIRYLSVRWQFKKANTFKWQTGEKAIFICSYFVNFDSKSALRGHFHSRHWEGLENLMKKLGLSENWLQIYYLHEDVPNPKSGMDLIGRINEVENNKKSFHAFLDSFLNWKMVFSILKRWIKLSIIAYRLIGIEKNSPNPDSPFRSLWPLMQEDWDTSLHGVVCIRNLIWFELFNKAMSEIPTQKMGLYLFEGFPWERAFVHTWKKHGHGKLISVIHTTARFWDLRLYSDHRTIKAAYQYSMPQADLKAINGKMAMETYSNLGYPKEKLVEIEALRYMSLLEVQNGNRRLPKDEKLKILILGDFVSYFTNPLLEFLVEAQKLIPRSATYTIKPHPTCYVEPSDYPSLNLKVETNPLQEIFQDYDMAISANLTSSSLEAYFSGMEIMVLLSQNYLNFSALRGRSDVNFVKKPSELVEIFQRVSSDKANHRDCKDVSDCNETFFLDPKLSRWEKLLLSMISK